jgi:hypothetical protein
VTQDDRAPRRAFYGLAEIADALGLNRQLVTVWRRRRSRGIPEPDAELSSGPIWLGATIEPWIDQVRAELGAAEAAPLTPELARRLVRRVLRLLVLVLEEQPRPRLLAQAVAGITELRAAIEAGAVDERGRAARAVLGALPADDTDLDSLRLRLTGLLPTIGTLVLGSTAGSADESVPSG